MRHKTFTMLSIGITLFSFSNASNAQTNFDIDLNKTYQVIDGFGASDAWTIDSTVKGWIKSGDEQSIKKFSDFLFSTESGIGLSIWRFNVGAGSAEQGSASGIPDYLRRAELFISTPGGTIDTSKQSGQVRILKEAKARGVENFIAFANSPPVWATKNGLAHPGSGGSEIGSTNLRSDKINDFSSFLVKVTQYLRDTVGIPINYISPVNEPTWEWTGKSQEANTYNNDDLKNVYRSLHSALKNAELDTKVEIDGVEAVEYTAALSDSYKIKFDKSAYNGGMNSKGLGKYRNYINDFLGDPEMKSLIGNKISMHGYWSDAWEDRMGTLRDYAYQNVSEVSPTAKIWMSEYCILGDATTLRPFAGNGWNTSDMVYALHVGRVIHRDLTRLNVSSWQWWLALTSGDYKDGLLKINSSLEAKSLTDSKLMWTLGAYSKFIRPGYIRVDLPHVDDLYGLMASAYKSPDNSKVVVVAINEKDTPQSIRLNINATTKTDIPTSFEVYITDATHNLEKVATTDSYTLPAKSIVTFVSDFNKSSSSSISTSSSSSSNQVVSSSSSQSTSNSSTATSPTKNSSGGSIDLYSFAALLFGLFFRIKFK